MFADKVCWADFYFDRNSGDIYNSPDILDDNLGPFKVKSSARAPVSKDVVLETFLAAIENKLFDVHRACHCPVSNLSKSQHKTLHQLHTFKDIVVTLQDKGSRYVILDRTDYIDKVESLTTLTMACLIYYPLIHHPLIIKWLETGELNG